MSTDLLLIVIASGLAAGALAGLASGLLGIGGGIVAVPSIFLILTEAGVSSPRLMHIAIGTSLAATSFSTFVSMLRHAKRGNVLCHALNRLIPSVIVGALLGASLAQWTPSHILRVVFGCVLLLIGTKFILERKKTVEGEPHHPTIALVGGGGVIGLISALLGVGGGFFLVPLLTFLKTPFRRAVGTASVTSFTITFISALCYVAYGLYAPVDVPDTLSLIFWPVWIGVAVGAVLTAPLGVKLVHVLPVALLKRLFGLLLLGAGLSMIFG